MNKIFTSLLTAALMMIAGEAMAAGSSIRVAGSVTPSGKGTVYVDGKTSAYTSTSNNDISGLSIEVKNIAAGYEFVSWSVTKSTTSASATCTIADPNSPSTTIDAAFPNANSTTWTYTVHANLQAITYNISYELDGGVNAEENPATYTVEDAIILKKPTKDGFRFAGWAEGNDIPAGSTGDKTFTAIWKAAGEAIDVNLSVSEIGMATFCAPFEVNLTEEGIAATAYTAELAGDVVKLAEIADGIIPAGTAVILQSEAPVAKTLSGVPAVTAETCTTGCLVGNLDYITEVAVGNYLLQNQEDKAGLAWYIVADAGKNIGVNRCYMTAGAAGARAFFTMDLGDATGIDSITTEEIAAKGNGKFLINNRIVIVKDGKVYDLRQ